MMEIEQLIQLALQARERAYAPYSHFSVGAVLEAAGGRVYTGCNVENAAYPVGMCAERTALCKAVSEGERRFTRIVIVGGGQEEGAVRFCAPCGMCRQMLREFCAGNEFQIILAVQSGETQIYTLNALLPQAFGPENLTSGDQNDRSGTV